MRLDELGPDAIKRWLRKPNQSHTVTSKGWQCRVEPIQRHDSTAALVILRHFSTDMVSVTVDSAGEVTGVRDLNVGWGSVSDQNGCNNFFSSLDIPYRYDRNKGNPRFRVTTAYRDGTPAV